MILSTDIGKAFLKNPIHTYDKKNLLIKWGLKDFSQHSKINLPQAHSKL